MDNGSVKAQATLGLRKLADGLSRLCDYPVEGVSLRHADKIDADSLHGKKAWVLYRYLRQQLMEGEKKFILIPLFFGSSRAITSFVPEQKTLLEAEFGPFDLIIADVLYPLPEGEQMLVDILYENICTANRGAELELHEVILVDHGSPYPHITKVREHIAAKLESLLGAEYHLSQAVMERREGAEYDFNGPLLKDCLLQMAHSGSKGAIVSMMFLLPGRHAGACGDIEQICNEVKQQFAQFNIYITPLVGEHSKLLEILSRRLKSVLSL